MVRRSKTVGCYKSNWHISLSGNVACFIPISEEEIQLILDTIKKSYSSDIYSFLLVEDEELLIELVENCCAKKATMLLLPAMANRRLHFMRRIIPPFTWSLPILGYQTWTAMRRFSKWKPLIRKLKRYWQPVILNRRKSKKILSSGFQRIIPKPYEPRLLFQQIHEVLHSWTPSGKNDYNLRVWRYNTTERVNFSGEEPCIHATILLTRPGYHDTLSLYQSIVCTFCNSTCIHQENFFE